MNAKPDALSVKHPYRCKECGWVYLWDFQTLMQHVSGLPCSHDWHTDLDMSHEHDTEPLETQEQEIDNT